MIDHIGIAVSDLARSRKFYEAALGALGMSVQMEVTSDQTESGGSALGFGVPGEKIFWIADEERPGEGTHVAFKADRRAQVDAFHEAGIEAGGRDNGKPGLSRTTARIIMRHSSSIRTAPTSKRSATRKNEGLHDRI